jgi:hypothetical protein
MIGGTGGFAVGTILVTAALVQAATEFQLNILEALFLNVPQPKAGYQGVHGELIAGLLMLPVSAIVITIGAIIMDYQITPKLVLSADPGPWPEK